MVAPPVEERRDIDHVASSPSVESNARVSLPPPIAVRSFSAHMDDDEDEIGGTAAKENHDIVLEETARPSRQDMIDEADDSDSPKRKRDAESLPEFKRCGRDKSALRKRRRSHRESRRKGEDHSSSESDDSVNPKKPKKKKESRKKHSRHDSSRRREKKEKRSRRSVSSD